MTILTMAAVALLGAPDYAPVMWIHPECEELPTKQMGPFVTLGDGSVLSVADNKALVSDDEGRSWQVRSTVSDSQQVEDPGRGAMIRTRDGVVVRALVNMKEKVFKWDYDGIGPLPECQLPVYVVRSLDGAKTWQPPEKLQEGWCGYVHNIVELDSGRLVLVSQVAVPDPGHHVSFTYVSDDEGKTWKRSNVIDLGGRGDHAGGIEATVAELEDGRLWMLIRTYKGRFWEAYSTDQGLTWVDVKPSSIEASGAPGVLLRLDSGRLMLAWNRFAEGRPKKMGRREELSIAFSEDDGKSWSDPQVIARNRTPEGERPVKYRLAYPDLYERRPGEIWITTGQGLLRVKLHERNFIPAD